MADPPSEPPSPSGGPGMGLGWQGAVVATLAVLAVGFGAGWLFGRATPRRAARSLLAEVVTAEPSGGPGRAVTTVAPSSGDPTGPPRCGVRREPVAPGGQVATLAAGGVVVQFRPGAIDPGALERLARLAGDHPDRVLVAPNPRLDAVVTATAWRRRMPLSSVDVGLLETFVTAHAGMRGPDLTPGRGPCRPR